jgi:hypothetical protein
LTEKQILLHIPLCNLLFNEEEVPEVNDANARAAVQESIAEFVTTEEQDENGWNIVLVACFLRGRLHYHVSKLSITQNFIS